MHSIQELYHSDFKAKLLIAHQLYQQNGEALRALPLVRQSLAVLEHHAQLLQEQMASLNLAPLCSNCALKPGGGCCSLYMADENDAVLFLINLLAGYPISIQKDDGFECYLLAPRGCILRFKPIFCLNYNCHAIKTHTDAAILSSYLAASAQLLQSQWQMETHILAYLRNLKKNR
jgi:hypothetical protein